MLFLKPIVFVLVLFSTLMGEARSKVFEVSWRKGGMENALQTAKEEKRPLLVYWGAVWCPPCNALKSRVFSDPKFIYATRNYIAVYLDGDTDDAQIWGEKLKAMGYPTLMVLSSQGEELVRLTPSATAEEMAQTLEVVVGESTSFLDKVLKWTPKSPLSGKDLDIIASFSWVQAPLLRTAGVGEKEKEEMKKSQRKLAEQLRAIAESNEKKTPEISLKIMLNAMSLHLSSLKEKEDISKKVGSVYRRDLEKVFSSKQRAKEYLSQYVYLVGDLKERLYKNEGAKFQDRILNLMTEVRKNQDLTFEDKLNTLYPVIAFYKDSKTVPDDVKGVVKEVADQILKQVKDPKKRHVALTDAAYYLHKVGESEKAKNILESELKSSISPYYLMSTLAYIESDQKNNEAALSWYRKAFEAPKGGATQLQWGYAYLAALIRLKPKETGEILKLAARLLQENTGRTDSFQGRSGRILARAKTNLETWAKDQKETEKVKAIFQVAQSKCSKKNSKLSYYQQSCKDYFVF
ncbi:MAG: thioredoxin family protein [Bdellovibrionales bacterium]|nr:thioredoxin family protein [Bdellovibrionales bacterium]